MADFFQNGIVTTLHDLDGGDTGRLDAEVVRLAGPGSPTLVLP